MFFLNIGIWYQLHKISFGFCFCPHFIFQSEKEISNWRQDRNFIVVTICFHFCHLVISIFPCIHCCTSFTDLSSNISITASDDNEQLRDSNAKLNRKWIFAKITKRVWFFNIHNHSRSSISNDIQVMFSNNYNVARRFIYFQQFVLTYCFFNTSTLLPSNYYHSKI